MLISHYSANIMNGGKESEKVQIRPKAQLSEDDNPILKVVFSERKWGI